MQIAILSLGILLVVGLLIFALAGPSSARTSVRRLNALRVRHSDSVDVKLEQQMKKAVAARRPLVMSARAEMSRMDRLRLRIQQTGKSWTVKQYFSVSAWASACFRALACHISSLAIWQKNG
jgi:tight adherence protein B